MVVAALEVEALGLQAADVEVRERDETLRRQPQRTELVAVDEIAEQPIGQARVHHGRKAKDADQAFDLDVVIIERERETGDEAWLEDDAGSPSVGFFGLKVRVSAGEPRILLGRIGRDVAVLCGCYAGRLAGLLARGRRWPFARIGIADEANRGGSEQFGHLRRSDCAVVTAAQANVGDRRELAFDLVGARVEAACSDMIIRKAIAGINLQEIDEIVLDDGDLDLAIELAHVGMTLDRGWGRAVAGEITGLELAVRAVGQ